MGTVSVRRLENSPISSNCFIIREDSIGGCILVDPAQQNHLLFGDLLEKEGLLPEYVILTHEHFDHIGGVEYIRGRFGSKVIANLSCSDKIRDPKKNLSLFYDQKGFSCSPADLIVDDNHSMVWRGHTIKFYETPGHSSGSICFGIADYLFSGDTLMQDDKRISKLPGGNKELLDLSIARLVQAFKEDSIVCPGHGEMFMLKHFKQIVS